MLIFPTIRGELGRMLWMVPTEVCGQSALEPPEAKQRGGTP